MTFLPIVARELRVAARRRGTFWTRTAVALGAIVTGAFFYLANLGTPAEIVAQRIFMGLMALSIFYCLFAGRLLTADCLSEEKRQGTLGLLFLTDLEGYDIVLGKLAATSLNGFYSLLAVFPVLAVPLLLGGIANGEFWRVVVVLANSFLFSLAVGIFVSSLSRETRRAMGGNLLLMLLLIGVPGACAFILTSLLPAYPFYQQWMLSCPLYALYLCGDSTYRFHQAYFWTSVAITHGLTWLLLALTGWTVRHCWQDRPAGAKRLSWHELWNFFKFGPLHQRGPYRKRLLNINAFYWLTSRTKSKPLQVWSVLLFVAAWWIWARMQFGALWLDESTSGTNLATAVMLNVALKLWVGIEAGRPLAEERQSGGFELLLSTSLTIQDILKGQWLALRRQFLAPTLFSVAVALVFMSIALHHAPGNSKLILGVWLGAIGMFAADVTALFWTAMYCALTTHSPNQAAISTISRIVIAPGIVFAAILVLANLYTYFSGTGGPNLGFYVAGWLGLGLTVDLIYGLAAWRQLKMRFRNLACAAPAKRTG